MNDWTAPVYAFFEPVPEIIYIDGRCVLAREEIHGLSIVILTQGTHDQQETYESMPKNCFSNDAVLDADATKDIDATRKIIAKNTNGLRDGSLSIILNQAGNMKKVTYSHKQHTKVKAKAEIVQWVAESMHPFSIVADRGFLTLMKTGRLGMYILSLSTVVCDVKQVFAKSQQRIAKMLQVRCSEMT